MLWIGAAALVVALSAATVAFAATQRSTSGSSAAPTRAAAQTAQRSNGWTGATMGGAVSVQGMNSLHAEHVGDMQAWFDRFGADPDSAAAQAALDKLRAEHWNDMRQLSKQYGVGPAATDKGGTTGGYGAGMMGGGSGYRGGMMGGGSGYGAGMMGGY